MPDFTFDITFRSNEPDRPEDTPEGMEEESATEDEETLFPITVGREIEAEAEVDCPDGFRCNRVLLQIVQRAHGAGDPDETIHAETVLHEGELPPNTHLSGQVTCEIPESGPMSYEGEYVKLSWLARVHIDIPWGFDRTWDSPFKVLPEILEHPDADTEEENRVESDEPDEGETPDPSKSSETSAPSESSEAQEEEEDDVPSAARAPESEGHVEETDEEKKKRFAALSAKVGEDDDADADGDGDVDADPDADDM